MSWITRFSSLIARLELVLLLLLAPFLIFPRPDLSPWLLLVIPALWLCRRVARGTWTVRTPLDVPLGILLVMVAVSAGATFDLARSWPKLCGVLLGIGLFYGLVNGVRTERGIWLATSLLLLGGVAIAGLSLVGTRWGARKIPLLLPFLAPMYERFPRLLQNVPRAEQGFNANQVGGTLTLFVPLTAALLIQQASDVGRRIRTGERISPRRWLSVLGIVVVLAATLGVLLLTQSRMSYLAVVGGLLLVLMSGALGAWPRRAAILVAVLGLVLMAYYGPERVGQALFGIPDVEALAGDPSWIGRVEVWRRAVRVLRDHPLTGIGFDALFPVVHARYPTFFIPSNQDLTHAHNLYLQVGLDLGLPGLVAFVGLLVAWGWGMRRVGRAGRSPAVRALAVGLFAGLAAQLLFGLADAIALGQKPGLATWAVLGLGTALIVHFTPSTSRPKFSMARIFAPIRAPALTGATLLLFLILVWGGGRLARARDWVALLQADLEGLAGAGGGGGERLAQAETALRAVRSDLLGIQREFALPLALAPHLGWVPVYGADLQAAPVLVQMGLDVTAAAESVLASVEPGEDESLVAALQEARPELERALVVLDRVRRARESLEPSVADMSPRLREGMAQLDQALPLMEYGLRGGLGLPELLGGLGPRTYLILLQNDDELRPTGGFISGVARLTVEEGRVVEMSFEDSYAVDDFSQPYPMAPQPFLESMGPVPWLFRDSNWSPDFPTAARMAVELYGRRYDVEIDGVLALDQQALRLFVAALQPLRVLEYPEPLTEENVISALRQSWAPAEGEGLTEAWQRHHKDMMGRLLTGMVHRVQDEPDQVDLVALAWAALQALEERHLFLYGPDLGAARDLFRRAGWDGALEDVPGDYVMLVDANLGFNKVNPYITESLSYTVDLRDPNRPQSTLIIRHRHDGPATGAPCRHEARYDVTYEQMMARCYWDYVRVYVPGGSHLREATAHPIPGSLFLTGQPRSGEAEVFTGVGGRTVFATFLVLAPGERAETRLVYDLPAGSVEWMEGGGRYRLYVQKQAGTDAREARVRLLLPIYARVVAAYPPPAERARDGLIYDLRLRTDVELSVVWEGG